MEAKKYRMKGEKSEQVVSENNFLIAKNIMRAYKKARRSRKKKQEVYFFDLNLEKNILSMLEDLKKRNYIHGKYKKIILYDSKKRIIYSPRFQDHILHHMVYKYIYEILDKKMVHSSFACRRGYGSHKGVKYLQKIIKKEQRRLEDTEKLYYLKIDFSKYFFSINHDFLKKKLRKFIENEDILYCIDLIIDSYSSPKNYDDLLGYVPYYVGEKNKGLPIGGILSQIFANFYLNELDQYLKHNLKVRFIRYMDDIIILGTKNKLKNTLEKILDFSEKEKLILHPKKTSFNLISDTISFVGYIIKDNKIFVGKRIKKGFIKFMNNLENIDINKLNLTEENKVTIESKYYSRIGAFKITNYGDRYISRRENIDFIRGGNANNGANTGVFTLNLNRTSTNQNRNVGFRCVE